MANAKSVLLIGLQPILIDFSSPDYAAFPDMDAAKVQAALDTDASRLNGLGYDAQLCLTDFGETAEAVVSEALRKKSFDCVLIGAGVRTVGKTFLLFEKLINVVHQLAPQAKLCFNTKPDDTTEAATQKMYPVPFYEARSIAHARERKHVGHRFGGMGGDSSYLGIHFVVRNPFRLGDANAADAGSPE